MLNFSINNDTKATLLLCIHLKSNSSFNPLSLTEYNKLVRWLFSQNLRPKDVLDSNVLKESSDAVLIPYKRLEYLTGRGIQLAIELEEWNRYGIWIISRGDDDYPKRLKFHLKEKSPALFFGCGDKSLLSGGGLAIVGSRNVDKNGEFFTRKIASWCAEKGVRIVSGGARGVDKISMTTTLSEGGQSIGILADSLFKQSLKDDYNGYLSEGQLLLLSPYRPDVAFNVGNAMGRNKLIYAMAECALVVSSDYNKGGTWAGAKEELGKDDSRPIFVRSDINSPLGNMKLAESGALKWMSEPMNP